MEILVRNMNWNGMEEILSNQDTNKKTALVFGHSSGLGYAISKALLNDGYVVVGISRRISDIKSESLVNLTIDLGDKKQVQKVCNEIKANHSDFDVLIYAAGTLTSHNMDKLVYEELDWIYRVNTFAPMIIESCLLGNIKLNKADVVNITSSALIDYYPTFAEYTSSKAAFAKFTADLQKHLKETESRVMDICPGGFTSNIYKSMSGDKIDRDESRQINAEDLADLILCFIKLPKRMEITNVLISRK